MNETETLWFVVYVLASALGGAVLWIAFERDDARMYKHLYECAKEEASDWREAVDRLTDEIPVVDQSGDEP